MLVEHRPGLLIGLLHGFTIEAIRRWCGVSRATAYAYRSGKARPSPAVVRLLTLHRQQRVLGDEWRGWRVEGNRLIDPTGAALTIGQIQAYQIVYQLAVEQTGKNWESVIGRHQSEI